MNFRATDPKITTSHLSRKAIIYIRRSSMRQVIQHKASGIYQHSFTKVAHAYGWDDSLIVALDLDDGRSGTDTTKRKGFQWLRQHVFEGKVGAIFCWEASRLARDNADFTQLIKLCSACDTLIIDEKGVYDANNINDSMYLGFMGVINQNESRRIGERSKAIRRMKAKAGALRLSPPTGYVYKGDRLVFDRNKKVREAIYLFFSTFDKYGSILQTVRHFSLNSIKIPTRARSKSNDGRIKLVKLTYGRASSMLKSPVFAGAYAYGRRKTIPAMVRADTTEQRKSRPRLRLDSDEVILIQGTHKGYITWEKFIKNQQRIQDNHNLFGSGSSGAVRNGPALLQGRVKCGKCGANLYILYSGKAASYVCNKERRFFGNDSCVHVDIHRMDKAVTAAVLEALSPAQVRVTLEAVEGVSQKAKADDDKRRENLKVAKAEAAEAKLRYESVDPRNRLVAEEYERAYEEKLAFVKQLEVKRFKTSKESSRRLSDEVRQSLLELGSDLRRLWECDAITHAERKQVLRCLISKVTVTKRENGECLDVDIHWATGVVTPLVVPRGHHHHPDAVEIMRKLAPDHTTTHIAERLNQLGFKPARSQKYTSGLLQDFFLNNGIKINCLGASRGGDAPRGDGRYSTGMIARMLNLNISTVSDWCDKGILDSVRDSPTSPRWIKISPEQVLQLKKELPAKVLKALKARVKDGG